MALDPIPMEIVGRAAANKATLSISSSAIGLGVVPPSATRAYITVEGAAIRFWVNNGATPTTTQGHLVNDGGSIELTAQEQLNYFKAIAVSGTATLQVSYF